MKIPFTTLHAHLKYMRLSALEPIGQMAMEFAFAEFFTEEGMNVRGHRIVTGVLDEAPRASEFSRGEQEPYKYRRFAGGVQLPRGRYYTVADSDGDDGFALEQELRSYVDHERSGQLLVYDGISRELARRSHGAPPAKSFDHSIRLRFIDNSVSPNPFITRLVEVGHISKRRDVDVALQYEVEHSTIPRLIDLRYPETQQWLYTNVTQGLPGVGYYYAPNHLVPGLVVCGERPTKSDLRSSLVQHGGTGQVFWYPPRVPWDGTVRDGPDDFFGLLPFLLYPGRGGSPITEAIGRWLQSLGANGLVYPSSRTDLRCIFGQQDSLTKSSGWNFVDYRAAPEPTKSAWVIMGPDSWWDLPAHTDVQRLGDGKSWLIVGTYQSHLDSFRASQSERGRET